MNNQNSERGPAKNDEPGRWDAKGRPTNGTRPRIPWATPAESVRWVGASAASRRLQQQLTMAGASEACVLLQGETGVGKDLAARVLHQKSHRRNQPFVAVNASSLGENLFESELFGHVKGSFSDAHQHHDGLVRAASGGTLFLDEIGELGSASQSKLLRFLDRREVRPVGGCQATAVDVRVVAATNRSLLEEVKAGRFRCDLYYRLRVLSLRIPPLRERRDDVPPLARHFLENFSSRFGKADLGIDAEVLDLLMAYNWPGNVRELANEIQRMVVLAAEPRSLGADLLSPHIASSRDHGSQEGVAERPRCRSLKERSQELERRLILDILERMDWNVSAAARELEMSRVGLAKKLRRMDIERPSM